MKIKLSKEDLQQVQLLLEVRDRNINVAEMFLYYIQNEAYSTNKESMDEVSSSLSCNEETAFRHILLTGLGIDPKDKEFVPYFQKGIQKLNPNKYRENPYYNNIHTDNIKFHNWEIGYVPYLAYEGFIFNDVTVEDNHYFSEITHLGFFDEEFSYLAVSESDVNWMSVTPNEIETMQKDIELVKGNVLTFGLGLGYFAYMASIKDEVEHVTIIEKNQDIIQLFNQYILPQFSHKEKITIISSDAFEYAQTKMINGHFNDAFVDLWHDASDGISLYLKMKKMESLFPNTTFRYWLEPSLLVMLRRCVLVLFSEQLEGSNDSNYIKAANDIDKIINRLYFLLKDYPINSYQDILFLLKDSSLKEIAKDLS